MWVEELRLDNVKCFESQPIRFTRGQGRVPWITLLGENGGGKSTVLQALALLLAGPESIQQLARRPLGWVRDEDKVGSISVRIHQDDRDPGRFGDERVTKSFGYTYHVTGAKPIEHRNRLYSEPTVVENPEKRLTWLRQNAFRADGHGWFGAGYGPFRRLTRSSQVIVPALLGQSRYSNFATQFNEDEALSAFERWIVYLDYRVAKSNDQSAKAQMDLGMEAINALLPDGSEFDSVAADGRILFKVEDSLVPTIALSDGYRSILALAGDLIWRLLASYPDSDNALHEPGVVLVDELDIHLHPFWQRHIAEWLQSQFPNVQFIVATHSPLIAVGAGPQAMTLKFDVVDGRSQVSEISHLAAYSVDRALMSPAFGLESVYSPQTQAKLDRYDQLLGAKQRSLRDTEELEQLSLFIEEARPYGGPPQPGSLDEKVEAFLRTRLP